jgi:hypothetical protein
MLGYYHDRATAKRHGKVARRVVEQKFSLDRMVADYVAIYEHSLSRDGLRDEPQDASRAGIVVGTATHGTRMGG